MHDDRYGERLGALLAKRGLVVAGSAWTPLAGGRTNLVWRVTPPDGHPVICKLYPDGRATPLFPNSSTAEVAALRSLSGTGVAPELIAAVQTEWGPVTLAQFAPGRAPADPVPVARALRTLHECDPPPGLRTLELRASQLQAEGLGMLDAAPPDLCELILSARPADSPDDSTGPLVFLHGDPVPANAQWDGARICLVDWQCPATGDAIFDLVIATSPSMRMSCGLHALDPARTAAFLLAYDDPATTGRFHAWRAQFTWRFACYAAWRVGQGDADYRMGCYAELALLRKLGDDNDQRDDPATDPGPRQ